MIKSLTLSDVFPSLYAEEPSQLELQAYGPDKGIQFDSHIRTEYVLRDGELEIEFQFHQVNPPDHWFGLIFRAGSHPFLGSHLILLRSNGSVELVGFPGPRPIETLGTVGAISGRVLVNIQFENDFLELSLGNTTLRSKRLSHQSVGRVFLAAYGANVSVFSAKAICRDTIEWS